MAFLTLIFANLVTSVFRKHTSGVLADAAQSALCLGFRCVEVRCADNFEI